MKSNTSNSKLNTPWLLKMAWRDAKASKGRLFLFMASIVLGIAAVVSIQLFSQNLERNIKVQSKALMGADFIIDTREEPNERAQFIIDSLKPDASEVNFVSMIQFPKSGGTKLVRVRALEGAFPFYGTITTEPSTAASDYQSTNGALVDATLMLQYDVVPGDSIKVGDLTLPISGALKAIPGSTAISSSVAPPIIIPYQKVDETNLLQFGSRKEYQFFYKDPNVDLELLEQRLRPMIDGERIDLDTHTETSQRLGRRYENVGKFLNLVAFFALLLGCVGIASSVNIYIKEKLSSVAVLKCLGASRKQIFLIFLIQIAGVGLFGGFIGTAIGVGLQELFPYILQEFLPFDVVVSVSIQPLIIGVLLGLLMSVLFALLPLMRTWYVSPLEVLRVSEDAGGQSKKARVVIFSVIGLSLFLFTFWLLEDLMFAFIFVIGIFVTFAILVGISLLAMKMVKTLFPKNAGYTVRQGLMNLFRPNNQTLVLILAIGLGTFLISTLYFTKDILLAKTEVGQSSESANLIALDVQSEQLDSVANTFKRNDLKVIDQIPLVTMRMQSIKGVPVSELRQDTTYQVRGWILNHEFRTTYRSELIASEELLEGEWVPKQTLNTKVKISISDNLAEDANVTVGDPIVFNIQGVRLETVVGSIRKVDWTRLQLNFSIVFPEGVLDEAPQFNVLTSYVPNNEQSADLQRELVAKFPNVSVIDLRQVYNIIEDILDKVSWIINFMAFFSILTGVIVLIGSVRNSKHQRIKESVLLRTLGAKSHQILKISALEYVFLGVLGSLVGIILALLGSFLLAIFVFKEPFIPSSIPFVVFLPAISLLVLLIGLANIRGVLKSSPLEVLRKEA